jgi:hypothetical protein
MEFIASLNWGSVADWFTGIVTAATLAVALLIIVGDRKRRATEHADAFVTWFEIVTFTGSKSGTRHEFAIFGYNSGTLPVAYALLSGPYDAGGRTDPSQLEPVLGADDQGDTTINPGSRFKETLQRTEIPDPTKYVVEFADGTGKVWRRRLSDGRYFGQKVKINARTRR